MITATKYLRCVRTCPKCPSTILYCMSSPMSRLTSNSPLSKRYNSSCRTLTDFSIQNRRLNRTVTSAGHYSDVVLTQTNPTLLKKVKIKSANLDLEKVLLISDDSPLK